MGDGRSYGDGGWGMARDSNRFSRQSLEPIRRSGLDSPWNSRGKKEAGAVSSELQGRQLDHPALLGAMGFLPGITLGRESAVQCSAGAQNGT